MMSEIDKIVALWDIVGNLAKSDAFVLNSYDDYECPFCEETANLSRDFQHEPSCIVTKARALVKGMGKS